MRARAVGDWTGLVGEETSAAEVFAADGDFGGVVDVGTSRGSMAGA